MKFLRLYIYIYMYFVFPVPFSLSFVCLCFSLLSLELGRCSSLIFFCPADHVPDWQPRVLLGMVEARSVNVKKTTSGQDWVGGYTRWPEAYLVTLFGRQMLFLVFLVNAGP